MFPLFSRLVLVPSYEKVLEEVAEELEGDILEREGRAMKQLQEVQVFGLIEGDEWRHIGSAESGIAAVDNSSEILRRYLRLRDIEGEDLISQFLERVVSPFALPV